MEVSDDKNTFTPRRSQRQRKLSVKALENASLYKKFENALKLDAASDEFSEPEECTDNREKPSILHNNETVSGDQIFTFKNRKKCEAVIQKNVTIQPNEAKTPHALRNKIKKRIGAQILEENDSSDLEFSNSESEYSVESEESEEDLSQSDSSEDEASAVKSRHVTLNKTMQQTAKRTQRNYSIKTDDYFTNHATKKIVTSNHTLDKLETPRLPQDQLHKLLSRVKLSKQHEIATKKLTDFNKTYFDKWLYLMHENFNILLYGLGSKKDILNFFHEQCLKKLPTIVINGFFPSLTIKDILDAVILDLLELGENPANIYECCELIEREFSYIQDTHLYIIIHNIDMIRNSKSQGVLSRLAAVSNIHLIASIDHINAPLIWDVSKLSKFNFSWWDVTNYHSYIDETSFESSMMVQTIGTLALSSLRNVFLSLTSNSKGIYLILVKYQIENGKKQYYQGLAFKELYSLCREAFLVSSDLALRAQLTEFVDHKMVKFKRSPDGTEYLVIPIPNTLLQQFLNEQSSGSS